MRLEAHFLSCPSCADEIPPYPSSTCDYCERDIHPGCKYYRIDPLTRDMLYLCADCLGE